MVWRANKYFCIEINFTKRSESQAELLTDYYSNWVKTPKTRVVFTVSWQSHLSFIRVWVFCVNSTIVLDVLEGIVHKTSIAAIVTILSGTVNQVLLREAHQISCLSEVLPFQWSSLKTYNWSQTSCGRQTTYNSSCCRYNCCWIQTKL